RAAEIREMRDGDVLMPAAAIVQVRPVTSLQITTIRSRSAAIVDAPLGWNVRTVPPVITEVVDRHIQRRFARERRKPLRFPCMEPGVLNLGRIGRLDSRIR